MLDLESLDLTDYVAMVVEWTWSDPKKSPNFKRWGDCLGVKNTKGWVEYGDFEQSCGRRDWVFLVPYDDAKVIGATLLTWKLNNVEDESGLGWYADFLKKHESTIPRKVKDDLDACRFYGSI